MTLCKREEVGDGGGREGERERKEGGGASSLGNSLRVQLGVSVELDTAWLPPVHRVGVHTLLAIGLSSQGPGSGAVSPGR